MTRAAAELHVRLLGLRANDRFWGWLGPLLVTALGGFMRFWRLDDPHQLVFDEAYYVKQGVSMLKAGHELRWDPNSTPGPDERFTQGTPDVFQVPADADFVVHPPLGKWMIAFGEWLFHPTSSFGWRFSAAVCGTLSILMIARLARRLLGSTLLGSTAGLLLAIDGHHLVHSRTGLLDVFLMFWALAAFCCLVIDRDQARRRLAALVEAGADVRHGGPGLGIRWWRVAAGACLGFTCAVKWSGLYFVVAFCLMTVLWDVGARRAVRTRNWALVGLGRDGILAFVQTIPVALAAYLVTWTGWFLSTDRGHSETDAWDRHWSYDPPENAEGKPWFIPHALRGLFHYHREQYDFHVKLTEDHLYQANPWSWLVLGRPTAFYYESRGQGQDGCEVAECAKAITPLGNPVIWWLAALAIFILLFRWAMRRDWRAGAILAGLAAGYLPWFFFQERTIFYFYAIAFTPFLVLAVTYVLGLLLGRPDASPERRTWGASAAGAIVLAAVLCFIFFWPLLTGEVIPRVQWTDRMWLPSWI